MRSGNYCKVCGHRILPNEPYCTGCGAKTGFDASDIDCVLTPPIHNIGFFNFQIDFSPYIITKNDFKYEICSCGYLNDKNNEFCYMCGAKRSESKLAKILKRKSKPKFSFDNVLCECGAVNSKENIYCEMCGKQLKEESMNRLFKERFENELTKARESLTKKGGKKTYEKVIERVGRAIQKYPSISKYYVIDYIRDEKNPKNR